MSLSPGAESEILLSHAIGFLLGYSPSALLGAVGFHSTKSGRKTGIDGSHCQQRHKWRMGTVRGVGVGLVFDFCHLVLDKYAPLRPTSLQ